MEKKMLVVGFALLALVLMAGCTGKSRSEKIEENIEGFMVLVDEMEKKYDAEVEEMDKEYEANVEAMNKEYEANVAEMRKDAQTKTLEECVRYKEPMDFYDEFYPQEFTSSRKVKQKSNLNYKDTLSDGTELDYIVYEEYSCLFINNEKRVLLTLNYFSNKHSYGNRQVSFKDIIENPSYGYNLGKPFKKRGSKVYYVYRDVPTNEIDEHDSSIWRIYVDEQLLEVELAFSGHYDRETAQSIVEGYAEILCSE